MTAAEELLDQVCALPLIEAHGGNVAGLWRMLEQLGVDLADRRDGTVVFAVVLTLIQVWIAAAFDKDRAAAHREVWSAVHALQTACVQARRGAVETDKAAGP